MNGAEEPNSLGGKCARRFAIEAGGNDRLLPTHRHALRREDQEACSAARLGHAGDPRRLQAPIGVAASDDREPVAVLIKGDSQHLPLLIEVQACTSEEWPLTVIAEMPSTATTSRRCSR